MEGETFADFFKRNEKRVHYHIHDLDILDDRNEYYVTGLCVMEVVENRSGECRFHRA